MPRNTPRPHTAPPSRRLSWGGFAGHANLFESAPWGSMPVAFSVGAFLLIPANGRHPAALPILICVFLKVNRVEPLLRCFAATGQSLQ